MNGNSMGAAYVHFLLVYFDAEKYAKAVAELLPRGAERKVWQRIYLYTGFVNVAEKTVAWSEEEGMLGGFRRSIANLFGTEKNALKIFDENDLASVLILAAEK